MFKDLDFNLTQTPLRRLGNWDVRSRIGGRFNYELSINNYELSIISCFRFLWGNAEHGFELLAKMLHFNVAYFVHHVAY